MCVFCNKINKQVFDFISEDNLYGEIVFKDNLPYLSVWDISLPGVEGKLPISYCPICGQKLTEEK